MRLNKGEEINLSCDASKGFGKMHSKWCPVSVSNFQYEAQVKLDYEKAIPLTPEQKIEFVNSCPTRVYSYNEKNNSIEVKAPERCVFCEECV